MRAKKHLGQHFLIDENIALKIAEALDYKPEFGSRVQALEIGPGTGMLTRFLLEKPMLELYAVEIDNEAQELILDRFPQMKGRLIRGDFLKLDLSQIFVSPLLLIGNIPYNITGPIFFKLLEIRDMVPEAVFMIQREVAQRLVAKNNTKEYGVLTVMVRTFYDVEYLFNVSSKAFSPPPRVVSTVIRLKRHNRYKVEDYDFYKYVVKTAFSQRRKTLKNALGRLYDISRVESELLQKRAEQLDIEDFIVLSRKVK